MSPRKNSRQRILDAASQLAQKEGSAHLSLEAVATLAGISKGGLLYNFPNKTALLKALVEQYVEKLSTAFDEQLDRNSSPSVPLEYFKVTVDEIDRHLPPPSGILAALSEDPDLLSPIRNFNRQLLDRIKASGGDVSVFFIAFLALEGMRMHRMFGIDTFSAKERDLVLKRLRSMLSED